MELIKKYLDALDKRTLDIEEDLGECHEIFYNAYAVNGLQAKVKPHTERVYVNGLMLVEGHDYRIQGDGMKKDLLMFLNHNSQTLQGSNVQVYYQGYTVKGEDNRWRW